MKTSLVKSRRSSGILLTECIVYLAVFTILTGIGGAAFYLCWDHSKALVYATDDINAALRAGERWRADVRSATGKISVEQTASADQMRIPIQGKEIIYRFESGEVRRDVSPQSPEVLLPKVNTSQMSTESRNGVTAWRWELNLVVRRQETQLPLLFTFEAAQSNP